MRATAKDLRFRVGPLLDAVRRGEEVVITYRGQPCAKLVPLEDRAKESQASALFGMWQDHADSEDVGAYVRRLRRGRGL